MTIERSIIEAATRLRRKGESHLIATVVRTQGSAYRGPGARMLLTHFRWLTGSVSGGCLEGDIASKGWWRTRDGEPVVVTYDSRTPEHADDDDVRSAFGLGCDGVVEVMLERGNTPGRIDPLEVADRCYRTQKRGAVATVIHSRVNGVKIGHRVAVLVGSDAQADASLDDVLRIAMAADCKAAIASGESVIRTYNSERGSVDVFVEAILPPPRVFIFGTGHDVVPLVSILKTLGWDISVCTSQPRVSTRQRFIGVADELLVGTRAEIAARIDECDCAVALVMSHNYETDRENVGMLLGTSARYIGVLGPRNRTAKLFSDLQVQPDSRVHAPVGLQLGAETPQEIALAIAAEVQSVLAKAPASSLRDRIGPIHDRPRMSRISEAFHAISPITAEAS
ncbi:MAG TPA: XdhC family protein [Kofleriaceae bacterium]|nr:XdhC family protein [Kofleriaceae bacterium]